MNKRPRFCSVTICDLSLRCALLLSTFYCIRHSVILASIMTYGDELCVTYSIRRFGLESYTVPDLGFTVVAPCSCKLIVLHGLYLSSQCHFIVPYSCPVHSPVAVRPVAFLPSCNYSGPNSQCFRNDWRRTAREQHINFVIISESMGMISPLPSN